MYSTPVDLSFSYLHSAVEASLDIKKDQVEQNKGEYLFQSVFCINLDDIGKKCQLNKKIWQLFLIEKNR